MKQVAHHSALAEYLCCEVKKGEFVRPKLDIYDLDKVLTKTVGFEHRKQYSQALRLLKSHYLEALK